ncbi:hypothetical protein MBLNU13_g11404t1 [Cladosporium sp. NU13]
MGENRGTRLDAVCWSLVAASAILLFLRVYSKLWSRRGLWWDDHFLLISWFSLVIAVSINSYIVSLGFGQRMATISDENLQKIKLNTIIVAAFGIIATTTGKTSFAITLYRITAEKWMKYFLIFVIITINISMNLVWIFGLAKCTPFEKVYNSKVPGTCWDKAKLGKFQLFAAYYSAILDFVLAFIPWQILRNLTMKRREKVGVAVAMSLGAVAGATGIVKSVMVVHMTDPDITYSRVDLTIWTLSEPAVSIMAISIPVLRMLYREIKSSSQRSGGNGRSRLASNDPRNTTNTTTTDTRKSKAFGFSAKYGRDAVSIMSAESQEALKDMESGKHDQEHRTGGIMKTEEFSVRQEQMASSGDEESLEMMPLGHGRPEPFDRK